MTARLPPEIWRSVFREATYVPALLSTSWDYDPEDQIWEGWFGESLHDARNVDEKLDTKCAIVQVCREWRKVGVEFLYEVIQVRQNLWEAPRLSNLVGTLAASNSATRSQSTTRSVSYGWWTKCVTFHSSSTITGTFYKFEEFFPLLEQCHNLEVLSISTTQNVAKVNHLRLLRLLESRFSHSFRRLDNYMLSPVSYVEVAPSRMPKLTSLGTILRSPIANPVDRGVSFKHITTLTIWSLVALSFPSHWTFPSLMTLSLRGMHYYSTNPMIQFVTRHNRTLLHLHLHMSNTFPRYHQISFFLSNVPGLRSVSLRKSNLRSFGDSRAAGQTFPKLAYLGILSDPDNEDSSPWTKDSLSSVLDEGLFPELRVIRLLSSKHTVAPGFTWSELTDPCKARGIRFEGRQGQEIDGGSGADWVNL